jgi:hypothetical protein
MNEHSILYSAAMVPPILDGTKTMTRRVIAGLPPAWQPSRRPESWGPQAADDRWPFFDLGDPVGTVGTTFRCPYGHPGDRLVMLTTWATEQRYDRVKPTDLHPAASIWSLWDGPTKPAWCGRLRPGRFLPSRMRDLMPRAEVVEVRPERVQDISESDAAAEGLTLDLCERLFLAAAGRLKPTVACYVEDADGNDLSLDGDLCETCAQKVARQEKGVVRRQGCPESDGPAYCDACQRPLVMSLSEFAIDTELLFNGDANEVPHYPASGLDAAIAAMIAGGLGDRRQRHVGRLLQIGFATLWDAINAKRGHPWAGNPWTWVITFRRVVEAMK